jgi:hypothetical protein
MSFGLLSPLGLLAALGVAVPIAVHLLQRRREATVDFPAVRFLLIARRRSARRLRLRRLLLLALRALAVLLFALVLARPVLYAPGAVFRRGEPGFTAVVLDTSLSMAARAGARTRFEEARSLAKAIAAEGGEQERFALVPGAQLPGAPAAPRWLDREAFARAVAGAAALPAVADPGRAFAEAYRLLGQAGGARRRILVITDLRRGGWERFSLAAVPRIDAGVPVRFFVLAAGGPDNRAGVVGIAARGESRVAGQPREVVAEVLNLGPEKLVPVELWLDGALAATRLETVAPGTTGRAVFRVRPERGGAHRAEVRLPADGYPEDDRRFLGLEATPPVSVTLVDGEPAASLTQSETFFLGEALRPERLAGAEPLGVETVGPEAIERAAAGARVMLLANVRAPGEAAAARLAQLVSDGGGLAIFWGRTCDAEAWQRALGPLLPAAVLGTEEAPGERPWRVGAVDYDAAPLAVFRPPAGGTLATASFTLRAALGAPGPAARVLARFEDGAPWIVEQTVGRGRVVLFASTADLEGNDLPTKPAFVPLVQRTVLWLAGSLEAAEDAEVVVGGEKVFTEGPELAGATISVETPGGARREVALRPAAAGSRAVFGETAEPGFYRWSRPGAEGVFAVNVPPEESDPATLTDAELDERVRPVRPEVVKVAPGRAAGEVSRLGVRGVGRPLLAALALVLLLESVVAGPPWRRRGARAGAGSGA